MFGSPSNDSNIKLNTMARLPACHDVQPSLSLIRISQADFLLGFPRLRRAAGLPGERILCPYPANYTRPRDVVGQYAHAVASKLSTHVRVLMAPWILSPGVPALAAPHTCTHTHTNKQTNKPRILRLSVSTPSPCLTALPTLGQTGQTAGMGRT